MTTWSAPAQPAGKRHFNGTHRTRSPEETWRAHAAVGKLAGVTRMANVTGLDVIGVPVYTAIRPNARSLAVTQGKGTTPMAAKVSALMEAIECWHAETLDLPVRRSTLAALVAAGERTVDLDAVHRQLPNPPAAAAVHEWVEGRDLLAGCSTWVPRDLVSLDFRYPPGAEPAYPQTTNGLASGNHHLEATVHGLCELIERDAVTLWFLDQGGDGSDRQVDLASVDDPDSLVLLERVRQAGLHAGVYDVTSDISVPTFACVIFDAAADLARLGYFWGFGTHLDPGVALSRAVSEAIQCRLTEITGARDDIGPEAYRANRDEEELEALRALVVGGPHPRSFSSLRSFASSSFEEDLARLCGALRGAGVGQAVAVDLTKPDVGVPVVRVVAPDLEGPPFEHLPGLRAQRLAGVAADGEGSR
jgi:YcaO-like protein with predicted kinase domain